MRFSIRTACVFVMCLGFVGLAFAQTSSGSLSGRVTYGGNGMPGVTVTETAVFFFGPVTGDRAGL